MPVAYSPVLRLDHAAYLDAMRVEANVPLAGNPPSLRIPRYCALTAKILPAMDRVRTSFATHIARVRCTLAGLAALQHRQATGAWPASLAACMTAVPEDPFDGKPLRYRVTPQGFLVYSVGKDRQDDGGDASRDEPWNYAAR